MVKIHTALVILAGGGKVAQQAGERFEGYFKLHQHLIRLLHEVKE